MEPFFKMKDNEGFSSLYKRVYIKNDIHFNEEGNSIIANNFLKMYSN